MIPVNPSVLVIFVSKANNSDLRIFETFMDLKVDRVPRLRTSFNPARHSFNISADIAGGTGFATRSTANKVNVKRI